MKSNKTIHYFLALAGVGLAASVSAQSVPDAGQVLRELKDGFVVPAPKRDLNMPEGAPVKQVASGGTKVQIQRVEVSGVTVFNPQFVHAAIAPLLDQSLDLAGLQNVANTLTNLYRQQGYSFATAILPAQTIQNGTLKIQVVEGRIGDVSAKASDPMMEKYAKEAVSTIQSGAVIKSEDLERSALLLSDIPGLKVLPVMKPGREVGYGDFYVEVAKDKPVVADFGFDNGGNRFTGEYRAKADIRLNSPFTFGDQLRINSLVSDQDLWLGSINYSLMASNRGDRVSFSYAHTAYELGKNYASLGRTGTAKISGVAYSLPVVRLNASNISFNLAYQHKDLEDKNALASVVETKRADNMLFTMLFDNQDSILGGGITYGQLVYTQGRTRLDDALAAIDRSSGANTQGNFKKYEVDVARIQTLPKSWNIYTRLSTQYTSKNVDSSESFSLGGPNGVRAYPVGEGVGDIGYIGQVELRYASGYWTPYALFDYGMIKVNADIYDATANKRIVSGYGVGLRYARNLGNDQSLRTDVVAAWRGIGGDPQSDTAHRVPRIWFNLSYRY